jgi:hypothetical protein
VGTGKTTWNYEVNRQWRNQRLGVVPVTLDNEVVPRVINSPYYTFFGQCLESCLYT